METGHALAPAEADRIAADFERMQQHAAEAARLLRALSNEHRLMVLCTLVGGECSVSDLLARIPLSQSALSQHLAVLRQDGLVATRRDGQSICYRLCGDKAPRLIHLLHELYCPDQER